MRNLMLKRALGKPERAPERAAAGINQPLPEVRRGYNPAIEMTECVEALTAAVKALTVDDLRPLLAIRDRTMKPMSKKKYTELSRQLKARERVI